MRSIILLASFVLFIACHNPDTLIDKADSVITGRVLPGEAAGQGGPIIVVISHTNELEKVNWTVHRDILSRFGNYKVEELTGGKYYIIAHLDENRNEKLDRGEYWGGHDANGDSRLDYVTLDGGTTLVQDISFIARY